MGVADDIISRLNDDSYVPDYERVNRGLDIAKAAGANPYARHSQTRRPQRHHSNYIDMRVDELLYRDGLLPREYVNPDADLSNLPDVDLIARDLLSFAGHDAPRDSKIELFRAANSSSDFPILLENLASKALAQGFLSSPETWQLWTKQTTTKDFREFTRPASTTIPTPELTAEHGESPVGNLLGDGGERASVQSYSTVIGITRQALASDNLQALTIDAFAAGRACARLVGDLAIAVLVDNSDLQDATSLFDSATHGNDFSTPSALSVDALDDMRALFSAQQGPGAESLNLRPRYILAAPAMETVLGVIRSSQNSPDPSDLSTGRISTLTDSRLNGSTSWFGIVSPLQAPGIEVVTLEGVDMPRIERVRLRETNTDASHFKIGFDVCVLATSYQGLCRNTGA